MVRFLIIDFPQNICDDDYYIIGFLCGNYTSLLVMCDTADTLYLNAV